MTTVTGRIHFDAAHRVMNHKTKCKLLHGHRYMVEATFEADHLDDIDMVIDFGEIKGRLGDWIDENWDHNTILNVKDKDLGEKIQSLTGQKVFYMEQNPTAEVMAHYIKYNVCKNLFPETHIKCVKIRLYETPNCFAEVL